MKKVKEEADMEALRCKGEPFIITKKFATPEECRDYTLFKGGNAFNFKIGKCVPYSCQGYHLQFEKKPTTQNAFDIYELSADCFTNIRYFAPFGMSTEVGCFRFSIDGHDLKESKKLDWYFISPEKCAEFCWASSSSPYSGTTEGKDCYCGKNWPEDARPQECEMRCQGSAKICGDKGAVTVFHTPRPINPIADAIQKKVKADKDECSYKKIKTVDDGDYAYCNTYHKLQAVNIMPSGSDDDNDDRNERGLRKCVAFAREQGANVFNFSKDFICDPFVCDEAKIMYTKKIGPNDIYQYKCK